MIQFRQLILPFGLGASADLVPLPMVVLLFGLMLNPAHASQAELQAAYGAYQEAAEAGDVRAALPHAQRAYELGLELYGADSRNTGLLAFNYGAALNEVHRFEEALPILEEGQLALEAAGGSEASSLFDMNIEIARSHMGIWHGLDALPYLRAALQLAQAEFGPESIEVAQSHYLIATIPFRQRGVDEFGVVGYVPRISGVTITERARTTQEHREIASHSTARGSSFMAWLAELREVRAAHIEPAEQILSTHPEAELENAKLSLLSAMYDIELDERNPHPRFAAAIEALNQLHYADMITFRLAVDWLSHPDRHTWSQRTLEHYWDISIEHGYYRQEGNHVFMLRLPPSYPRSAAVSGQEARVCVQFNLTNRGQTEDIVVYESEGLRIFNQSAVEAIENFVTAPRIENRVPVPTAGVRNCFDYQMQR